MNSILIIRLNKSLVISQLILHYFAATGDKASHTFHERLLFTALAVLKSPTQKFDTIELAVLLVTLDSTIIDTAIPKITKLLHVFDDAGWYGSV